MSDLEKPSAAPVPVGLVLAAVVYGIWLGFLLVLAIIQKAL